MIPLLKFPFDKLSVIGMVSSISPNIISGVVEDLHPVARVVSWVFAFAIGIYTWKIKKAEWKRLKRLEDISSSRSGSK